LPPTFILRSYPIEFFVRNLEHSPFGAEEERAIFLQQLTCREVARRVGIDAKRPLEGGNVKSGDGMSSVNYDNGNNIKPQFAQLLLNFGQQYVAIFVRNVI
jgi:hypothetical protein